MFERVELKCTKEQMHLARLLAKKSETGYASSMLWFARDIEEKKPGVPTAPEYTQPEERIKRANTIL